MTPRPSRGPLASKSALRALLRRLPVLLTLVAALTVPPAGRAADGDPDYSFGNQGRVTLQLPPLVNGVSRGVAVRAQPDGRILVLAEYQTSAAVDPTALLLYRLLPDGDLDPTFGADGIEILEAYPTSPIFGKALELLDDGKILVGADAQPVVSRSWVVTRRLPDGDADPGFGLGSSGWIDIQFPSIGTFSELHGLATSVNGSTTLVGSTKVDAQHTVATFARITPAGTLDPSFGAGGLSSAELGNPTFQNSHTWAYDVLVEPDGATVVFSGAAWTYDPSVGGSHHGILGRLVDGVFDPTFNGTGYRYFSFLPVGGGDTSYQELLSVSRFADGSYVAAGNYVSGPPTFRSALVHVLADGTIDTGWGFSGYSWFVFDVAATESEVRRCDLDAAERPVCFGTMILSTFNFIALARFEGPWFDTRFGSGGTWAYSWSNTNLSPADLAFDSSGRILTVWTGGNMTQYGAIVMRSLAGLPFRDDFESGLLQAWSASNP